MNKRLLNTIVVESNYVRYKVLFFEENGVRTFELVANDDLTEQYLDIINDKFYSSFIIPWSMKELELDTMNNYVQDNIKIQISPFKSNIIQFKLR